MSESDNHLDLSAQMLTPRYAPRPQPLPIPTARWDEEPLLCLKVNDQWVSHILGVLVAMDQGDTWIGTKEQIIDARQQVNEIMLAFMEDCDPMSNCCPEPNRTRINSDGTLEVSYDGGTTWESGDDFDPRLTAPQFPPLGGDPGDQKRCDAAANVVFHFQAHAEQLAADASLWSTLSGLVGAFVTLLLFLSAVSLGTLTPIVMALAAALLAGGRDAFIAAMTADVYATFQCIIYCHMDENGKIEESDLNSIYLDINTQLSGIAAVFLAQTVYFMGVVGINNMAATATGTEGNCLDCDCGICGSNWSAGFYFGGVLLHADTLDEQGEGYIIVNSYDRGDGVQFAAATAPNASSGCWFTWTLLDHTPSIPAPASCDCGVTPAYESQVINFLMPNPTSGTMFSVLSTSTDGSVPFRLRLDFDTTDCNP